MPTEFDPVKALQEEIAGLVDTHKVVRMRMQNVERSTGEMEVELLALRKIVGFAESELSRKRKVLVQLINERDGK